jgi:tetratricopeptide (TPR) repeat protein
MKNLFRALVGILALSCLGVAAWLLFRGRSLETEYAVNRDAGKNLAEEGSFGEAATHLQDALQAARELDPKDARVDQVISDLADAYGAQGEYVQTQHLYMEALQRAVEKHGSDSPQVGKAFNDLGRSARLQGRFDVAEGMYNQAITIWEKLGIEANLKEAAASYAGLAAVLSALQRPNDATVVYERALALNEKDLGKDNPQLASLLREHAAVLAQLNRTDDARKLEQRASALMPPAAKPADTPPPSAAMLPMDPPVVPDATPDQAKR